MTIAELIEKLQSRPLQLYPQATWQPELSRQIADNVADEAVRAGLLLWNDDLEASHQIAQHMENPTGSFWHAIIHRREGDAANSQYWWRRTGEHAAFENINDRVLKLLENEVDNDAQEFARALRQAKTWQPIEFVEQCEMARRGQFNEAWLERVQAVEIETLVEWCRAQAK